MKLVLVDDHRILVEGISELLNESFEVAAIFSDPVKALAFLREKPADLLMTDYEMPGLNGIELFRKAKDAQPLLKGVLLSVHDEAALLRRAVDASFDGFLLKNVGSIELNAALWKISQGHSYISAELTKKILRPQTDSGSLSEREMEVLKLIVKEYSNKQMADALNLSERTIETYRKNLFRKAGTTNVVGLVKFAYANKLVE